MSICYTTLLIPCRLTVHAAHQIDSGLPAGISGYDLNDIKYPIKHANNKSRELLGIDYIDIPQSTKDILAQFKERGWY